MIVPDLWPEVPPHYKEADAKFTEAIGAISVRHPTELGERECEVAYHAAQGRTAGETGSQLYLTENTIRTHRSQAFRAAGVHTMETLVYIGLDSGWIPYEPIEGQQQHDMLKVVTPAKVTLLKAIILGITLAAYAEEVSRKRSTPKTHFQHLSSFGRSQAQMVTTLFRLGLCAPSVSPLAVILSERVKNPKTDGRTSKVARYEFMQDEKTGRQRIAVHKVA